jgi:hypothetical protein
MLAAYLLGVGAIVLGIICGMNALLVLLNGVDETEHFGRTAAWAATLVVIAAVLIQGGRFILMY